MLMLTVASVNTVAGVKLIEQVVSVSGVSISMVDDKVRYVMPPDTKLYPKVRLCLLGGLTMVSIVM